MNEVVPKGATGVRFSDISGQEKAKAALQEMVVLPRFGNDFTSHHLPCLNDDAHSLFELGKLLKYIICLFFQCQT